MIETLIVGPSCRKDSQRDTGRRWEPAFHQVPSQGDANCKEKKRELGDNPALLLLGLKELNCQEGLSSWVSIKEWSLNQSFKTITVGMYNSTYPQAIWP